jgi:hypothetical protein
MVHQNGVHARKDVIIMNVSINHIKMISKLSKLPKSKLIALNKKQERLYTGRELTKYQLIFQLTFLMDAPNEIRNGLMKGLAYDCF